MYQIGDRVVYGSHGVCCIVAQEERVVDRKKIKYFALEPLSQTGARFFIPSENSTVLSKLRHLITREELDHLLSKSYSEQEHWINEENARKQRYRELIISGNLEAIIGMLHFLRLHREHQREAGRKFHLCDDNFLNDAQKLLKTEFSVVLDIPQEEVEDYIDRKMNSK